jgi:dienelactone hydrolase
MRRRLAALLLLSLAELAAASDSAAGPTEVVHFESARVRLGVLTARQAAKEHVAPASPPTITGYFVKPDSRIRFPAVVMLHGCAGLSESFKRNPEDSPWISRLVSWGYGVLAVDSTSSHGATGACGQDLDFYRVADAFGALAYLARRNDVDEAHVFVLGFAAGGIAALSGVEQHDYEPFEMSADFKFKGAIAFYPVCVSESVMAAPALVLVGELDDWSPVARCKFMIAGGEGRGAPITLVVYPGRAQVFGDLALRPARRLFGHFSAYDRAATDDAIVQVKTFLERNK